MVRGFLLLAASLLAALHAGFFYAWSFSVMNGLDVASAAAAIEAMQTMNANVRNAAFGTVFFGAPAVAMLTTVILFLSRRGVSGFLTLLGLAGLVTSVAITVTVHLPLNEALDIQFIPADHIAATRIWTEYSASWTAWNHLRALTSLAGCLFLILAFRMDRRTG